MFLKLMYLLFILALLVFVAAWSLLLAMASRGYSSCGAPASHCGGFLAAEHRLEACRLQ